MVICEIWWELFGVATSYTINLVAVAIVSLGCTGTEIIDNLSINQIIEGISGKVIFGLTNKYYNLFDKYNLTNI